MAEPEIYRALSIRDLRALISFNGPNQSDLQPPPSAHGQESH